MTCWLPEEKSLNKNPFILPMGKMLALGHICSPLCLSAQWTLCTAAVLPQYKPSHQCVVVLLLQKAKRNFHQQSDVVFYPCKMQSNVVQGWFLHTNTLPPAHIFFLAVLLWRIIPPALALQVGDFPASAQAARMDGVHSQAQKESKASLKKWGKKGWGQLPPLAGDSDTPTCSLVAPSRGLHCVDLNPAYR